MVLDIKEVICIMCPLGCKMKVKIEGNKISQSQGNKCERGLIYAYQEVFFAGRILTTTVKTANPKVPLLPVRSDKEIPKKRLIDCMMEIAKHSIGDTMPAGQIVIRDILHLGVNIISTRAIS